MRVRKAVGPRVLPINHDYCLEVLVARGKAVAIKRMADQLIGAKGLSTTA